MTIGFETVNVAVLESAGQAQLCVAVLQPVGIPSLPFGVTVTANSVEGTAGELPEWCGAALVHRLSKLFFCRRK